MTNKTVTELVISLSYFEPTMKSTKHFIGDDGFDMDSPAVFPGHLCQALTEMGVHLEPGEICAAELERFFTSATLRIARHFIDPRLRGLVPGLLGIFSGWMEIFIDHPNAALTIRKGT